MGYYPGKRILHTCAALFLTVLSFHLHGNNAEDIPDYFAFSTPASGRGGGTLLSHGTEYMLNPSLVMLRRQFTVSGSYLFKQSGSVIIADSMTSKVGGGIAYAGHNGFNAVKTNFAFPFFSHMFGGINYSHYWGDRYDLQSDVSYSQVLDAGISASIASYFMLGFAAKDLLAIAGPNLPIKLNFQGEVPIVKNMLLLNVAFIFHPEHREEDISPRRSFMNFTDWSAGLSFKYKLFEISTGLYNSSFNPKFNFATTLKTFALGITEVSTGGIHAGYYFRKGFHSFSINIVWNINLKDK